MTVTLTGFRLMLFVVVLVSALQYCSSFTPTPSSCHFLQANSLLSRHVSSHFYPELRRPETPCIRRTRTPKSQMRLGLSRCSMTMADVNPQTKPLDPVTETYAAHSMALELEKDEVWVDMNKVLGSGTFGDVFEAVIVNGPRKGTRAIAKRAKSRTFKEPPKSSLSEGNKAVEAKDWEEWCDVVFDAAPGFLKVESEINSRCATNCREVVPPYLGSVEQHGSQWLLWEHVGAVETLEHVLEECHERRSMLPLARGLGVKYEEGSVSDLRAVVNEAARQLLVCCSKLQKAGIAHRDIKPENLIIAHHQMLLIDFGAAAVMGDFPMIGYNDLEAPGDGKYAPPERFIDELEWTKYDVYCVGLILLRILMPPMLADDGYIEFRNGFRASGHDIDAWFARLVLADPMIQNVQGKHRAELPAFGFPRLSQRIREYERLAVMSCVMHYDDEEGPHLSLCALKDGLAALSNDHLDGLVWDTLHSMLAADPSQRPSADEALSQLSGEQRGVLARTKAAQTDALQDPWLEVIGTDGGKYYWNRVTNETTMVGEAKPTTVRSERAQLQAQSDAADLVISAYTAE